MSNEQKVPISYYTKFREYSIELCQKGVFQDIYYCPWCGTKLPSSLREEWFNYLESMLENFLGSEDSRIPS
jgi:hypothetical protein